jgi:hypothetical protein
MIEKFIKENIERDIKHFETTDDLYERYLNFSRFNNFDPVSRVKFAHAIRKIGVGVRHSFRGKAARWGVKLLPCKY